MLRCVGVLVLFVVVQACACSIQDVAHCTNLRNVCEDERLPYCTSAFHACLSQHHCTEQSQPRAVKDQFIKRDNVYIIGNNPQTEL